VAQKLVAFLLSAILVVAAICVPISCSKSDSGTNPSGSIITVAGKVVNLSGVAVGSVPVVIGALPPATTDANGNFTIANVPVPYDITVVNSGTKSGLVYIGLTRSDPTLTFIVSSALANSATVSGTVSGGAGYPLPANHASVAAFVSPEVTSSNTINATTGAYSLSTSWMTPQSTTGALYALQWQRDPTTSLPVAYKGYGTKTGVALLTGGTFANQNITLSSVGAASFSGTVTAPAGYALSDRSVTVLFSTGGIGILSDGSAPSSPTSTTFNYVTPNVSGATLRLGATASKGVVTVTGSKAGFAVNATGATLALPSGPDYSLPIDAATAVSTSTDFVWTPMTNAVFIVQFAGPAGQPRYQIVTTATTAKLPNLTALGLTLPANTLYSWSILSIAPVNSIDAVAASVGLLGLLTATGPNEGYTASTGLVAPRKFTTAP
jgi:hypothetical protein